jgi:hypothetical protein
MDRGRFTEKNERNEGTGHTFVRRKQDEPR